MADVVGLAAGAGLEVLEWAGDVHVPADDLAAAADAQAATVDHGLRVGTYGTYYKAGVDDPDAVPALVRTARELGAPRLRVWAGTVGSDDTPVLQRAAVVEALRECVDRAGEAGLGVVVEHHVSSLTDTLASALTLRSEVPGLVAHWQPRELPDTGECLAEVHALVPAVVHAFSWGADGFTERLPLDARADLWRPVLAALAAQGGDAEVVLEFVPGDDVDAFERDAARLRGWRDEQLSVAS
ncbi:sugar phosphate isomerase/epimerase [Pseudonocardia sp. MH-G8]|uniref:sugar phosphate isomerase/epimerase family protein n=1 Tax=Pseudonocardia sp. MH-G8 TaxID=1854588 RepID=UPI001E36A1C5|nr:TIM barrel protein [Pseudonocardia sp. MH-G8]